MSELDSADTLFNDITRGLESSYWGRDPYGNDAWEYVLSSQELLLANQVLVRCGMEPAEKIYFGRHSEFSSQNRVGEFFPGYETVNVNLQDGKLIRLYGLTKYYDSDEIVMRKDVHVDGDNSDLINILQAVVRGVDLFSGLREHTCELHEIESSELLALQGLTKILVGRNNESNGGV